MLIPERFRGHHPQHRDAYVAAPSARPMGTGLELYGRRKDGTEFPVDIMLSPVESSGEQSILTVIRDITDRKQAETALRRSEERFRLLVEGASDYAIFMLDPEGRVATWNSGAERIKGYRAEEILGQHFSKFYPQESVERGKPQHELEVASAEGRYEDEGWRIRKDGSRFWANVIITALRGKDGQLKGFSKVTRDFTDRKGAEESLVLELSKAVLANPDIRQMLAAIEASIQRLIPHDLATIALYDASNPQRAANATTIFRGRTGPNSGGNAPNRRHAGGLGLRQPGTASDEPDRRQKSRPTNPPTQGGNQVGLLGSPEQSR